MRAAIRVRPRLPASPNNRAALRRLFCLYDVHELSVWNSYALVCTSAAATSSLACEHLNLRCSHESHNHNCSFETRSERIAVLGSGLPSLAPFGWDLGEIRGIYSNLSLRALELRRAMKLIQLDQFDPARLLTYVLSRLVDAHAGEDTTRKNVSGRIGATGRQLPGSPPETPGEILRAAEWRWPSRYY